MQKIAQYLAAVATGTSGILHLIVFWFIGHAVQVGLFFLLVGIIQLFWVLPMIRQQGRVWYYAGVIGMAALVILWSVTRVPNPITHTALPVNTIGIIEEVSEISFIGLTLLLMRAQRSYVIGETKTKTV